MQLHTMCQLVAAGCLPGCRSETPTRDYAGSSTQKKKENKRQRSAQVPFVIISRSSNLHHPSSYHSSSCGCHAAQRPESSLLPRSEWQLSDCQPCATSCMIMYFLLCASPFGDHVPITNPMCRMAWCLYRKNSQPITCVLLPLTSVSQQAESSAPGNPISKDRQGGLHVRTPRTSMQNHAQEHHMDGQSLAGTPTRTHAQSVHTQCVRLASRDNRM
jgi:hypothetical protein